jgi:hypothetical protein
MWWLAVLQVMLAIWEFVGFAWGGGHLPRIGRPNRWDGIIAKAEEEWMRLGEAGGQQHVRKRWGGLRKIGGRRGGCGRIRWGGLI